jgi:hypothetical protein
MNALEKMKEAILQEARALYVSFTVFYLQYVHAKRPP